MDFNRKWTQFALDAECDHFGMERIAKAHNDLLAEVSRLREALSVIALHSVCCDARHCADRVLSGGPATIEA
jgi:hypothetical protein